MSTVHGIFLSIELVYHDVMTVTAHNSFARHFFSITFDLELDLERGRCRNVDLTN